MQCPSLERPPCSAITSGKNVAVSRPCDWTALAWARWPTGRGLRETRIVYAGAAEAGSLRDRCVAASIARGRWITPGLIDCHTHLVHAGDRSHEFELRLQAASYDEIARAGGGILSTMKATCAASEPELVISALKRLDALIAEGATTVEVKSGYGLDLDTECKQLRSRESWQDDARSTSRPRSWALTPSRPRPPPKTPLSIWSVPR